MKIPSLAGMRNKNRVLGTRWCKRAFRGIGLGTGAHGTGGLVPPAPGFGGVVEVLDSLFFGLFFFGFGNLQVGACAFRTR